MSLLNAFLIEEFDDVLGNKFKGILLGFSASFLAFAMPA